MYGSRRKAAPHIGVTPAALGKFLKGETPYDQTLDKYEAWLAGVNSINSSVGNGATPDGEVDSDAEFWREYRSIQASDLPPRWKVWKVDQLTEALRQLTQARDADAARARTRLMERDIDAAGERRRDARDEWGEAPGASPETTGVSEDAEGTGTE